MLSFSVLFFPSSLFYLYKIPGDDGDDYCY
jgi:hypothetical protein